MSEVGQSENNRRSDGLRPFAAQCYARGFVIVLTDYEGRSIRLTDERWDHIKEHPEMVRLREAVAETLRQPEAVIESPSDPLAKLYYRFYHGTMVGGKYVCVVVKVLAGDAFVVTAYLTDRVKKGASVWQEKS